MGIQTASPSERGVQSRGHLGAGGWAGTAARPSQGRVRARRRGNRAAKRR